MSISSEIPFTKVYLHWIILYFLSLFSVLCIWFILLCWNDCWAWTIWNTLIWICIGNNICATTIYTYLIFIHILFRFLQIFYQCQYDAIKQSIWTIKFEIKHFLNYWSTIYQWEKCSNYSNPFIACVIVFFAPFFDGEDLPC